MKITYILVGAICLLLFSRAYQWEATLVDPKTEAKTHCEGTPIRVTFPYAGDMMDPHTCIVQCRDQKKKYILYTNGKATQCSSLPGCTDWGEDSGVTCIPPKTV